MLAMFILNISPNVSFSTLKSNTIGAFIPNSCSYDSRGKSPAAAQENQFAGYRT